MKEFPMRIARTVLFTLLAVTALAVAQEETVYVAAAASPLLDAPGGTPLGVLSITTPLTVVERADGHVRVRVVGVAEPDGRTPAVVYDEAANRIQVFVADDAAPVGGPADADGWTPVELDGWLPDDAVVNALDELFAEAATTYQRYCSRCHAGYAGPVEDLVRRMKPHEWPEVARRMATGTGIRDAEFELVLQWLQVQSEAAWADR
jgi:YD repeat-containing protein